MPLAHANAPSSPDQPPDADGLLAAFVAHQAVTGRGNISATRGAQAFLRSWPDPQDWADEPFEVRVALGQPMLPFVMFAMVGGWLRPGWDWLVRRKLSSLWREIIGTRLEADLNRFVQTAVMIGFTPIVAHRSASQSVARLLIQTGQPMNQLDLADLDGLADACRARQTETGQGWRHYRGALLVAQQVLFHLQILELAPVHPQQPHPFDQRLADTTPPLRGSFIAIWTESLGPAGPRPSQALPPAWPTSADSWRSIIPNWHRWPILIARSTSSPT